MASALQNEGFAIENYLLPPANTDGVSRLASDLVKRIERYSEGQDLADISVQLAFTEPAEHATNQCIIRALLPLQPRSEEHTSELQSRPHLVCRLLLEKKKNRA